MGFVSRISGIEGLGGVTISKDLVGIVGKSVRPGEVMGGEGKKGEIFALE